MSLLTTDHLFRPVIVYVAGRPCREPLTGVGAMALDCEWESAADRAATTALADFNMATYATAMVPFATVQLSRLSDRQQD